jgi:hypothetical protein
MTSSAQLPRIRCCTPNGTDAPCSSQRSNTFEALGLAYAKPTSRPLSSLLLSYRITKREPSFRWQSLKSWSDEGCAASIDLCGLNPVAHSMLIQCFPKAQAEARHLTAAFTGLHRMGIELPIEPKRTMALNEYARLSALLRTRRLLSESQFAGGAAE